MKVGSEHGFSIAEVAEMKTWVQTMVVPRDRQPVGVIGSIHSGWHDEVG